MCVVSSCRKSIADDNDDPASLEYLPPSKVSRAAAVSMLEEMQIHVLSTVHSTENPSSNTSILRILILVASGHGPGLCNSMQAGNLHACHCVVRKQWMDKYLGVSEHPLWLKVLDVQCIPAPVSRCPSACRVHGTGRSYVHPVTGRIWPQESSGPARVHDSCRPVCLSV